MTDSAPRTEAGRTTLTWFRDNFDWGADEMELDILAIEAEAALPGPVSAEAPLDVERLAEATWNVNKRDWEEKGGQWPASFANERNPSIWLAEAAHVAAEYARLAAPAVQEEGR